MFSSHVNPMSQIPSTSPPYFGGSLGHGDTEKVDGGGGSGTRRNFTKNLVPVTARLLLQHHDHDEPLLVNGQKVGMVSLVGQVRQISKGNLSYSYLVEDDTGRIEAIHYIEDDNDKPPPVVPNTFVKIIGALKHGHDQNMMTVYKVTNITDMHEVTAHKLELVVLPLRAAKQQAMAAMAAQASFNCLQFGNFGGGFPWNSQVAQPGFMGRRGDEVESQLGRNNSFPKQPPIHFNHLQNSFLFTPPLNPDAQKVLTSIKKCPMQIGISRNELSKNFRTSLSDQKINEILEFLTVEGLIYSTIDQFHFRSTDS